MEESIRVETQFLQNECDSDDDDNSSLTTTTELALESSRQASFAETTTLEMKEVMDYWKARVSTATTQTTATCSMLMPQNSLTVPGEDEEEDSAFVASSRRHDHIDDNDNDTVASSYSGPLEQQKQQNHQAPPQIMPPRQVLFSRQHKRRCSSLTCVTNCPQDNVDEDFSFSLGKGNKQQQLCSDNASITTASTHMMSTYSNDTSSISESSGSSTSSNCGQHQFAFFHPASTSTTTYTAASSCSSGRYPVVFWSDENHIMIHTTPPPSMIGETEDYPIVKNVLRLPLLVSHPCDDAREIEHFHWTACQQQIQVNMACSRAQWMADSLTALLLVNDHDNHRSSSLDDDAPANSTLSCLNRNATASQQQPLLLTRMLRLWTQRAHWQLRLARGRIANELYIGFCQALPLEYLRLWVYLRHFLIHSSYWLYETANSKNNNYVVGTTRSDDFVKKTLKRDLIMTSFFILVVAMQVRIQSSLQQSQHAADTSTPCLVCFQMNGTLSSQTSFVAETATTLPFRTQYFETVQYSGLSSTLSSGQDDWLLL